MVLFLGVKSLLNILYPTSILYTCSLYLPQLSAPLHQSPAELLCCTVFRIPSLLPSAWQSQLSSRNWDRNTHQLQIHVIKSTTSDLCSLYCKLTFDCRSSIEIHCSRTREAIGGTLSLPEGSRPELAALGPPHKRGNLAGKSARSLDRNPVSEVGVVDTSHTQRLLRLTG